MVCQNVCPLFCGAVNTSGSCKSDVESKFNQVNGIVGRTGGGDPAHLWSHRFNSEATSEQNQLRLNLDSEIIPIQDETSLGLLLVAQSICARLKCTAYMGRDHARTTLAQKLFGVLTWRSTNVKLMRGCHASC
jgi:hypothetical protein